LGLRAVSPGATGCARGIGSDDHGAPPAQPASSSVGPEQVDPLELPPELEELELLGELELEELEELDDPLELPESLEPLPPLDPLLACAMLRVVRAGAAYAPIASAAIRARVRRRERPSCSMSLIFVTSTLVSFAQSRRSQACDIWMKLDCGKKSALATRRWFIPAI
jgi:hypothetical protein